MGSNIAKFLNAKKALVQAPGAAIQRGKCSANKLDYYKLIKCYGPNTAMVPIQHARTKTISESMNSLGRQANEQKINWA